MNECHDHKYRVQNDITDAGCSYCRIVELEQQLSRYQGGVKVEGSVTMMENGLTVPGLNAVLAKFPYKVHVLVKEVE